MSRNPLKSGQCFLPKNEKEAVARMREGMSQSPQIGSMFPTEVIK